MYIYPKTLKDIKNIRIVGILAAETLQNIKKYIRPGINTEKINNICHKYINNIQKAYSATLGYHGYPKSICISINNIACHGIPSKKTILKPGDIVNIDISIKYKKYFADTSKMFKVGKINKLANHLCKVAQYSLYLAISLIKPGLYLNIIGKYIQKYVTKENFSLVEEYCGHGIGKKLHENPPILHHIDNNYDNGIILKPGMTFTIEPIINVGGKKLILMKDGWTLKTKDNNLSAQYEHTILVKHNGCEIITYREDDLITHNIIY